MTDAITSCIGKLPIHGDFVRHNLAPAPEIVEFDRWLLAGMERGYGARGRAFEAELRTLPPLRFLFISPTTGRLLHGILVPSADQVGRAYPFVAGFAGPAPAPGPAYDRLPLLAGDSLQALLDLATRGVAETTLPQFLGRLQEISYQADDNAAEQTLRSFLFGHTLDSLWAEWPGFQQHERRLQCLQECWQLTRPPFPPRYLTSIPTHGQPGEAAFWLTLLRQWLPMRANPVLVAWPANADTPGAIRLVFDELHARYFEPLFWPDNQGNQQLRLAGSHAARRDGNVAIPSMAALLRPRALLQDVILAATRG